jgi:hypothetical protein
MPLLHSVSTLQLDIPQQLGLRDVHEPIHVFLFSKKATYERYMQQYFPTVPRRQALFVKQRGPGMVFAYHGQNIATDLRHEMTHAVLHGTLPMVPLWLDEGLAEYFETPVADRAHGHPHLKSVVARAQWRRVANLSSLEELDDISGMRAAHYRDAWAWVHFMLHGPAPGRAILEGFLKDIEAHVPPGKLSHRLRSGMPRLNEHYLRHFRQWR